MIDISVLREDPDRLRAALARRSIDLDVDALVELDERRRAVRFAAEELRAEQKRVGKEVPTLEGDARDAAIARAGELAGEYKAQVAEADELDGRFDALWIKVPNLAHESAPDGLTDEDNVEFKRWGEIPDAGFDPLDHRELGERLGMIDIERAARLSGTRFGYLTGAAVFLELGLVRFAMDRLAEAGFTPVVPPVLVRGQALYGTGFFPDDSDQVYEIPKDDLYLVGTSEVPLAGLHMDEILDEEDLPIRYAGFSTCFRREAGTHGKDTAGIFRVHQFDKVEMFSFCHPDRSWEEHDFLFSMEESLVQALEIPYRVVNVAAGDLGASAAKKYDIEAWIPTQGRYREITSCSNTTDFQSRRLKIRYRSESGNRLVHTLNGTAIAVGRFIIALMENHQQADGTIAIPEALQPYVGTDVIGA
jgi:seryl-tRNA synthetase